MAGQLQVAVPRVRVARMGRAAVEGAAPFTIAAASSGLLAIDEGGYLATTWGWAALALAWVAGLGLVLREGRVSRLELGWIGGLTALTAWTAASMLWTSTQTQTALEVERTFVYLLAAIAVAAVTRSIAYRGLLWGTWAGSSARLPVRARDAALPGAVRRRRSGRRLPPLRSDRLLERARPACRDGGPPRRRPGNAGSARLGEGTRRRVGAAAAADALLHLQPRRLARARRGPARGVPRSPRGGCSSPPPCSSRHCPRPPPSGSPTTRSRSTRRTRSSRPRPRPATRSPGGCCCSPRQRPS